MLSGVVEIKDSYCHRLVLDSKADNGDIEAVITNIAYATVHATAEIN